MSSHMWIWQCLPMISNLSCKPDLMFLQSFLHVDVAMPPPDIKTLSLQSTPRCLHIAPITSKYKLAGSGEVCREGYVVTALLKRSTIVKRNRMLMKTGYSPEMLSTFLEGAHPCRFHGILPGQPGQVDAISGTCPGFNPCCYP